MTWRLRAKEIVDLFKQTAAEWIEDDAPQFGAALAYYSVFSLALMVLLLIAVIGVLFRDDPVGAWSRITEQMSYFLDKSAITMVQQIAAQVSSPAKSVLGGTIGFALALFGASGVFGQLQNALNIIWGVKAKPGRNLGICSDALSFFCAHRRSRIPASRFARHRSGDQRLQSLFAIGSARRAHHHHSDLSHVRFSDRDRGLRNDL